MTEERTGPHAGEHWNTVWDAFCEHYEKYRQENPSWRAFFTEHHMYALDESLRAYDKARGFTAEWGLRIDGHDKPRGCTEHSAWLAAPDETPERRLVGPWTPATPNPPEVTP